MSHHYKVLVYESDGVEADIGVEVELDVANISVGSNEFENDFLDGALLEAKNAAGGYSIQNSGRWYIEKDGEWTTFDKVYGPNDNNFNEKAGVGTSPNVKWDCAGHFLKAGEKLKEINIIGRTTDKNKVPSLEIYIRSHIGDFSVAGVGTDTQAQATEVLAATDLNLNSEGTDSEKMNTRTIPIDYTMPSDGMIFLYLRNSDNNQTKKYFYCTYTLRVES